MKKIKENWLKIGIVIIVLIIVSIYTFYHFYKRNDCSTIAIISISNVMISSPMYNDDGSLNRNNTVTSDVIDNIRKAEKDKKVKAIVFLIDSGGGVIQSGEEITDALKEVTKPTVSLIRSQGKSSAYWVASATGRIFASKTSDTASIGVTMSYIDNAKQNEANGLTFNRMSYGKYKDMGNLNKPLTEDEKKILMEQVKEEADYFTQEVADNRNLPIEKIKELESSEILATQALEIGLIDEIGSFADVDRYLSKILKRNIHMCIPNTKVEENNNNF